MSPWQAIQRLSMQLVQQGKEVPWTSFSSLILITQRTSMQLKRRWNLCIMIEQFLWQERRKLFGQYSWQIVPDRQFHHGFPNIFLRLFMNGLKKTHTGRSWLVKGPMWANHWPMRSRRSTGCFVTIAANNGCFSTRSLRLLSNDSGQMHAWSMWRIGCFQ